MLRVYYATKVLQSAGVPKYMVLIAEWIALYAK